MIRFGRVRESLPTGFVIDGFTHPYGYAGEPYALLLGQQLRGIQQV